MMCSLLQHGMSPSLCPSHLLISQLVASSHDRHGHVPDLDLDLDLDHDLDQSPFGNPHGLTCNAIII